MTTNDEPKVITPNLDDLLSLHQVAQMCELSASHLRLLVRRGEIWAKKLGRTWYTTQEAVNEYLALEHKPGPKPKKPSEPDTESDVESE